MRETKITGFERNKRKAWSLGRKRKDKERDGTKIWRRFLQAEEQAARFEFRRWDTGAGTRLAEQFGGGRGVPKWPEAPGVCKFRLIEKNDEVPGVPPRVHFQPLFLFRCVLPEWPRALRQTSYLPIYLPTPPSIYEVRDGAALSLSYPSILTIATNAVPLSYHCHSPHRPLSARCFLFSSLSLSRSPFPPFPSSTLLSSRFQPVPFTRVYGRSPRTSIRVSLSASFHQIYTLFFAANCLSLGAARGSTGEGGGEGRVAQ